MVTAKPPSLSTNFFRTVRSCRPQTYRSIRNRPIASSRRARLHTTSRRLQADTGYQRYGPAAQPPMPPPPKPTDPYLPSTEQTQRDASDVERKKTERKKKEAKDEEQQQQQQQRQKKEEEGEEGEEEEHGQQADAKGGDGQSTELLEAAPKPNPAEAEKSTDQPPQSQQQSQLLTDGEPLRNRELDIVLSIPTPNEIKGDPTNGSHHPHLEASPYEHHFDTYTLVQDLCKPTPSPDKPDASPTSPFTEEQSVTMMKAIRLMLAANLDLAKDGLVSKSDTENETYLFRAACSELKTTIQTSRFTEAQKQRSQRAQVQHEFDILNQKVSQDIMTMREELKGMFNDRKLGLQEEKRHVDGKIQGLSYRISVDLNSEAKSEVEGLRWVLTRRAALAIGAAASMIISFLQYNGMRSREQAEIAKKRKKAQDEQDERLRREQERFGTGTLGVGARSQGTQTDGIVLGGTAGSANYEESLG